MPQSELHRVLFESSSDAIMLLNGHGFFDCNPATLKMFGAQSREEFLSKHPSELSPVEQPCGTSSEALANERIGHAFEHGSNQFEWVHQKVDGSTFDAEVWLTSYKHEGEVALQATVRDISKRKAIEKELITAKQQAEQASAAKSEFLSVMSHELRTPLHGIIGLLDLMRTEPMSDQQQQDLNMARQSAKSLQTLVNDILDLSKVEAGKLTLEHKSFDIETCLRDVFRTFVVAVRNKNISLTANLDNIPQHITGDSVRIRQILVNLIGNAVKFTSEGGVQLHITLQKNEGHTSLQFAIKDTGVGIDSESLSSIFDAFTQVQPLMNRQHGGTGLGTTIAKRLVEHMQGHIWVESELGQGSTFTFRIPCSEDSTRISNQIDIHHVDDKLDFSSPLIVVPSFGESDLDKKEWNILLAEDDLISQKIAMKRLSDSGCHPELAKNGQQAWEMYQQNDYDLILMDLRMPIMDGLTLTRKIRAAETNEQHIPIIGLSAHAMENIQQDCLDAGMDSFLTKPIEPKQIISRMHQILARMIHE